MGTWAIGPPIFYKKEGAKLIAVQDALGTIYNQDGIDIEALLEHSNNNNRQVVGFEGAEAMAQDRFFELECDIVIPAALGNQITKENAKKIKAFLIAEGANGPTTVEAEKILLKRKVAIIPDILCNSGGVIGSYFEWLQNRHGELWQMDEVLKKIEKKLNEVFTKVIDFAAEKDFDLRTAAFALAISRLEQAYVQRGIFP